MNAAEPTGLLDVLTIRQNKGSFSDLTVAIVGVGELRLISPPVLAPDPVTVPDATIVDDLEDGLRIRRERIGKTMAKQ